MVLPAVTRMVMSLMFTPSRLARLARNCARRAPAKSVESPAMVKVAETTSTADAPGGGLGGGGRGGGGPKQVEIGPEKSVIVVPPMEQTKTFALTSELT